MHQLPCPIGLFHLFGPLKQHLCGWQLYNNEEMEMTVGEALQMQEPILLPQHF
jgi:hypothetical protein